MILLLLLTLIINIFSDLIMVIFFILLGVRS